MDNGFKHFEEYFWQSCVSSSRSSLSGERLILTIVTWNIAFITVKIKIDNNLKLSVRKALSVTDVMSVYLPYESMWTNDNYLV